VEEKQMKQHHHKIKTESEKSFFAIQLAVLNDSGAILSILCMPNLLTLAVGLSDGRMVLYDLSGEKLEAFHLAFPPNEASPLTHMTYIEPTDDPRCPVFLWTFHSSTDGAIAVMHSLIFKSKVDGNYKDFKMCNVQLTMPMFTKGTFPVCCRSIRKSFTQDEEDILTLILLAWTSPTRKKTNIMLFDLNQWYKDEMPPVGNWRTPLKYAVVFELDDCTSLDVAIDERSVFPFNSIDRPEEHFHPNSLSFDVCVLKGDEFTHLRWLGVQNAVLQAFNNIGPQMILEPNFYFNQLLGVTIAPQDSNCNASSSIVSLNFVQLEFFVSNLFLLGPEARVSSLSGFGIQLHWIPSEVRLGVGGRKIRWQRQLDGNWAVNAH